VISPRSGSFPWPFLCPRGRAGSPTINPRFFLQKIATTPLQ
jgi:hypothetical protein